MESAGDRTLLCPVEAGTAETDVCLAVCRQFAEKDFDAVLRAFCGMAFSCGAKRVHLAFAAGGAGPAGETFAAGGYAFTRVCDVVSMQRALTGPEPGFVPFRLKRLRPLFAPVYAALYREAFAGVLHAAALDETEAAALAEDPARECGFFMVGGEPYGVYRVAYGDGLPEIETLAVRPDLQKRGYGRRALRTLEQRLLDRGETAVLLTVSTANTAACRLYRACGYTAGARLYRWYGCRDARPT